jgi:hypothetical protein
MFFGLLALITSALFTGAALYISFAEQPARMKLVPPSALMHWKPSYARGLIMQAALVAIAGLLGIIAFFYGWYWKWLLGAFFLLLNIPYTMYIIMPLNHELKAIEPASAPDETRAMIGRWGWLHFLRGILGLLGTLVYLWAAMGMLALAANPTAAP